MKTKNIICINVICIFAFSVILFSSLSFALDGKLYISLNLPNDNYVCSAKSGNVSSDIAKFSYLNPANAYIASFGNNIIYSLSSPNAQIIKAQNHSNTHTISIFSNNDIYLGFTKGDYRTIEKNYGKIKEDLLLYSLSPAFAYIDIDEKLSVITGAIYSNINITGNLNLGEGNYELLIKNLGVDIFGKPLVEIMRK